MKTLNKILMFAIAFTIINCSSGGSGGDDSPDPMPITPPSAATLEFPLNNSECTEGTNATTTESTITFDWSDSNNTDSYQLVLKNLETQSTSNHSSNVSEVDITLLKGTPYSWYVISRNSGTQTAQSSTWKFYNAGEAVTSYAPFPAELVAPNMGSALDSNISNVLLEWNGSDVDDDIAEYEVLFGTDNPPTTSQGVVSASNIDVNVTSGNTYYWIVITKDSQGNSSTSEIFQFKIN
ncbi:MAG TPA: hypothetical protein VKN14_08830 [Flavobacteriaceae bacterium]|nr:hypothetical protein [Flavobacteriaceae bacterium]